MTMNLHEFDDELWMNIEQLRSLRRKLQPNIVGTYEGFWVDASDIMTTVTVKLDKLLEQVRLRSQPRGIDINTSIDLSIFADFADDGDQGGPYPGDHPLGSKSSDDESWDEDEE
jgi:hypothetical protein